MTDPNVTGDVLRELLRTLPNVVLLIGEDRKIHFINRAEAGESVEEIVGADALHGVPAEDREAAAAAIERVFRTQEPVQRITEIVGPDGERQWYEGSLLPIVRDGRVAYVLIVSTNVTARIRALHELETLHELVPLCAWCGKKVRTEDGEWTSLEEYIERESNRRVTHGMCPDCDERMRRKLNEQGA